MSGGDPLLNLTLEKDLGSNSIYLNDVWLLSPGNGSSQGGFAWELLAQDAPGYTGEFPKIRVRAR